LQRGIMNQNLGATAKLEIPKLDHRIKANAANNL